MANTEWNKVATRRKPKRTGCCCASCRHRREMLAGCTALISWTRYFQSTCSMRWGEMRQSIHFGLTQGQQKHVRSKKYHDGNRDTNSLEAYASIQLHSGRCDKTQSDTRRRMRETCMVVGSGRPIVIDPSLPVAHCIAAPSLIRTTDAYAACISGGYWNTSDGVYI